MATRDQKVLLDFAEEVLSAEEYDALVRLLHMREDRNPRVRAEANIDLVPLIAKLKAYFDVHQKPRLHAV